MKPPSVMRLQEWSDPIAPVRREVISARAAEHGSGEFTYGSTTLDASTGSETKRPPVLFVPGSATEPGCSRSTGSSTRPLGAFRPTR